MGHIVKMRKGIIALLLIVVVIIAIRLSNKEDKGYELTNYIVRTGDTLWSIAEEYAPEDMDIREYIYFACAYLVSPVQFTEASIISLSIFN